MRPDRRRWRRRQWRRLQAACPAAPPAAGPLAALLLWDASPLALPHAPLALLLLLPQLQLVLSLFRCCLARRRRWGRRRRFSQPLWPAGCSARVGCMHVSRTTAWRRAGVPGAAEGPVQPLQHIERGCRRLRTSWPRCNASQASSNTYATQAGGGGPACEPPNEGSRRLSRMGQALAPLCIIASLLPLAPVSSPRVPAHPSRRAHPARQRAPLNSPHLFPPAGRFWLPCPAPRSSTSSTSA